MISAGVGHGVSGRVLVALMATAAGVEGGPGLACGISWRREPAVSHGSGRDARALDVARTAG